MADQELAKAPCNRCHRDTNHVVLAKRTIVSSEEIEEWGLVECEEIYEMLECCGCESVTLLHKQSFDDIWDDRTEYYPPPLARSSPRWRWKLPDQLRKLLDEMYSALNANSRMLALMGARAALDMLFTDKIGDIGGFQEKLERLEKKGFVAKRNREFLLAMLDAGHAAAHRGYEPTQEQLTHVMDILENLLEAVYILEHVAETLKQTTPPRVKRNGAAMQST